MAAERKIILTLGGTNQGKTLLAKMMCAGYFGPVRGKVIVLDRNGKWRAPGPVGEFPEDAWTDPAGLERWAARLTGNGKGPPFSEMVGAEGALLILDDADDYLPTAPNAKTQWRPVMIRNRHLRLDVLVIGHSPATLHKDWFAMCSEIWLFRTFEKNAMEYLSDTLSNLGLDLSSFKVPDRKGLALRICTKPDETGEIPPPMYVDLFAMLGDRRLP